MSKYEHVAAVLERETVAHKDLKDLTAEELGKIESALAEYAESTETLTSDNADLSSENGELNSRLKKSGAKITELLELSETLEMQVSDLKDQLGSAPNAQRELDKINKVVPGSYEKEGTHYRFKKGRLKLRIPLNTKSKNGLTLGDKVFAENEIIASTDALKIPAIMEKLISMESGSIEAFDPKRENK